MINEKAYKLGSQRSSIRELFEYGRKRIAEVGKENVLDFSLGNPSTPSPKEVEEAFSKILETLPPLAVHGYTSAPGCDEIRSAISSSLTRQFDFRVNPENLYITCGAAAALTSVFAALTENENDEFITLAPFFPEYRCFAGVSGAKFKVVPADEVNFQINFNCLEKTINENTKGVIVNSPNNPSGTVYSEETIKKLTELLNEKSRRYNKPIFIISDEPYRELVYGGASVPFIPEYYDNTIVCYSYSKKLSLPGERIGYVLVPERVVEWKKVFDAVAGAARMFGYVCAPSLIQRVIAECVEVSPDLGVYETNRNLLYNSLTEMGYYCAKPDGAFYLFVKSPKGDGNYFSEIAKRKDVLIVPGGPFGCDNFVRIAYCVDTEVCERALPRFREIIDTI
ncbi:MAG: pyridoxal phosphate-dependent aminotransferase [Clostridiales bacterium]|jgi:aspartate aminotransferase|nr:pyridoxal phosphate-dependent aminotransferase [Clostridiales bacterium]